MIADLVSGAVAGRTRDIARLLTVIENDPAQAHAIAAALQGFPRDATVVGITGPPGVGKSTTTSALVQWYRGIGKRVAVLAVDPSSPFSGGALLGDRVRMQQHATDPGVFIRSMAARGHLGGLAAATPLAVAALQACPFDVVILETVGVGQSEIDVVRMADTTILVLAPGLGDGIQAAKAGIIEIADIFVVNKADRDGVDATVRELRAVIALGTWRGWEPPVIKVQATTGSGVDVLATEIDRHGAWLLSSGQAEQQRRERIRDHIRAVATGMVSASLGDLDDLVVAVDDGRMTVFEAAWQLVAPLRAGSPPRTM